MEPTVQIRTDKTWVRSHPLWDGIHDESLDLEAIQIDGATTPAIGVMVLSCSSQPGISDLGVATNSCTTP
jgi:hypothetical protein